MYKRQHQNTLRDTHSYHRAATAHPAVHQRQAQVSIAALTAWTPCASVHQVVALADLLYQPLRTGCTGRQGSQTPRHSVQGIPRSARTLLQCLSGYNYGCNPAVRHDGCLESYSRNVDESHLRRHYNQSVVLWIVDASQGHLQLYCETYTVPSGGDRMSLP